MSSSMVGRLLIDNHWHLAKLTMASSFIFGFAYTFHTGRPLLNLGGAGMGDKKASPAFQSVRLGSTFTAMDMPPRP